MHPFLSRTRASMTFCPTTKWRPSKGFRTSISTERHGMWRSSALSGLPFRTVALSATLLPGRAVFVAFLVADVFRVVVFSFFFFIRVAQSKILQTASRVSQDMSIQAESCALPRLGSAGNLKRFQLY